MPTKIVIGKTYGMLTVDAATTQKDYRGRTLYHCTCECTGTRLVAADRLLAGGVISCGCMQKKAQEQIGGSKERRGWTAEEEAVRIAKLMTGSSGIYQRVQSAMAGFPHERAYIRIVFILLEVQQQGQGYIRMRHTSL